MTTPTPAKTKDTYPEGMMEEIKWFLHDMHPLLIPGQDSYPEVFRTGTFFPLQRRLELEFMMRTARDTSPSPITIMEIGSDKGGGLYHWCMCLPTVKQVIACEIRGLPYAKMFEDAFPHIDFLWVERSSQSRESIEEIKEWLGDEKIDCLFLDGDKRRYEQDFDTYLPLMNKPGGRVFFHDIQEGKPREAFHNLYSKGYPGCLVIDTKESRDAMDREEKGIPLANAHEQWLRFWAGASAGVGVLFIQ